MILATAGTQLPFPRLFEALDAIAAEHAVEIIAQTCASGASYAHLRVFDTLPPPDFERYSSKAHILVGHAGIGTVLTAKRLAKPLIIFPRLASLGEHRNEHQLATAEALESVPGIYVARDGATLAALIVRTDLLPVRHGDQGRRAALLSRVRNFIAA